MAVKQPAKAKHSEEFERLTNWRFKALLELGLAADQAMSLIEIPDIVHAARKLSEQGCPPAIIASLLGE